MSKNKLDNGKDAALLIQYKRDLIYQYSLSVKHLKYSRFRVTKLVDELYVLYSIISNSNIGVLDKIAIMGAVSSSLYLIINYMSNLGMSTENVIQKKLEITRELHMWETLK